MDDNTFQSEKSERKKKTSGGCRALQPIVQLAGRRSEERRGGSCESLLIAPAAIQLSSMDGLPNSRSIPPLLHFTEEEEVRNQHQKKHEEDSIQASQVKTSSSITATSQFFPRTRNKQEKTQETKLESAPLEKDTTSKIKKKPGRKKKKEGAPKRPMSAYNFFFQEERKRLLDALPKQNDGLRKKKRRDRSPHNKISFATLGKTIGRNWKQLGSVEMERYEELARIDTDRYLREMKAFEAKEKQEAAGLVDLKGKEDCIISKNKWHSTPRSQQDFQGSVKQQANSFDSSDQYAISILSSQYSHLMYQQSGGYLQGNASFDSNVTNFQTPNQAPYTSPPFMMMSYQQLLPQSTSSNHEFAALGNYSSVASRGTTNNEAPQQTTNTTPLVTMPHQQSLPKTTTSNYSLENASSENNLNQYQAPHQVSYTSPFSPQQQESSEFSFSNQECPDAVLFSSTDPMEKEDIIEPIPFEMVSRTYTQQESPTLYYFEKESGTKFNKF